MKPLSFQDACALVVSIGCQQIANQIAIECDLAKRGPEEGLVGMITFFGMELERVVRKCAVPGREDDLRQALTAAFLVGIAGSAREAEHLLGPPRPKPSIN